MHAALLEVKLHIVLVYLDKIVAVSRSAGEHNNHSEPVLALSRELEVTTKRMICNFLSETIKSVPRESSNARIDIVA